MYQPIEMLKDVTVTNEQNGTWIEYLSYLKGTTLVRHIDGLGYVLDRVESFNKDSKELLLGAPYRGIVCKDLNEAFNLLGE